jgi:3-keto-5-aminohexanoate cleavage enzyme
MDPLVISVGINGGEHSKDDSPYVPITPEEIVASVCGAAEAGAAVTHIHVRDEEGRPSGDLKQLQTIIDGIRESSDVIINVSTDVRHEAFDVLDMAPELASFPGGSVNYEEGILEATMPVLRKLAKRMAEVGTKAELEIFHDGMIDPCLELAREGLLPQPLYFQFALGLKGGAPANPRTLVCLVDSLPPGTTWGVMGVGTRAGISMAMMGMVLGGHVRVGIEDQLEYLPGRLAVSNAELVERVVRLAGECGREIATPTQARELLKIGQR